MGVKFFFKSLQILDPKKFGFQLMDLQDKYKLGLSWLGRLQVELNLGHFPLP